MSDKAKTTDAKEGELTPALVPKLRFPEFAAEPVRNVLLGDVTEECTSRRGKEMASAPIMGVSKTDGIVPMMARLIGKDVSRYMLLSPDWFAYNPMRINIGSIARWRGDRDVLVSPDYVVFRCLDNSESGISADYLDQFRCSDQWDKFVTGSGDGGVRIRIYYKDLARLSVRLPRLPEQQKIASCLSSVDELISAQARKVDALKTHRKGLMQQLFPREGETQPRLRFPDFQNAGEWARMSIQEMIDTQFIIGHLDGNHGELYPKAEEFSQTKEGIPYITANDFIDGSVEFSRCKRLPIERARLFRKGVAKDGDILFAHNATVGPVAKLTTSEEFVILSTTATYFRCNAKHLSNDFLKSALSSPNFVAQYSRVMSQSTRNQVPITTQRKLELDVPKPPEQQRIASCLSSLDALITAETQKHEALKTHKKGLMHQLFPSPEEVTDS
jgi:type I restriction enzyme S subunit